MPPSNKPIFRFISMIALLAFACHARCQTLVNNRERYLFQDGDSLNRIEATTAAKRHVLPSFAVPALLVASGLVVEFAPPHTVLGKERIQQHVLDKTGGDFSTEADNYLQFAPLAAMFGLSLAGQKGRSDLLNQAILTAKAELLMNLVVNSMKFMIHDTRPDGSTDNSMPSGHTAQAFVSAALLDMEYRDTSPWISAGGYLCATVTGYLRVANNRHWASDVLIGAGIGIASVRTVYLTHRYRWGTKRTGLLVPVLVPKGGGVAFSMRF